MMDISFAIGAEEFKNGKKTVTRRDWKDCHARKFKKGTIFCAINKDRRAVEKINLFETALELITIEPSKEMPEAVFLECARLAFFTELMHKLPDGRVIWDEKMTDIYSEDVARAEYEAVQRGWIKVSFTLPKASIEEML